MRIYSGIQILDLLQAALDFNSNFIYFAEKSPNPLC